MHNIDNINKFILDYVNKDFSGMSILLSGDWGSGKTFYVKNQLKKYLEKNKVQCLYMSAFGEKDINEFAKKLFMQVKLQKAENIVKTNKIIPVTSSVINGVLSFFNIDLKQDFKDIEKLYTDFSLTGKLIIIDDIERTNIDMIELLGFINDLTQEAHGKILLICNEKMLDDDSKYWKYKEKTIINKIEFKCDIKNIIKEIIDMYADYPLNRFLEDKYINEIFNLFNELNKYNLRLFMLACKKTNDIFSNLNITRINMDILRTVFYGNIAFLLKYELTPQKWEGQNRVSYNLGTTDFPLFKICYDYITNNELTTNYLKNLKKDYKEMAMYDELFSYTNKDLDVIFNYNIYTETEIEITLKNVEKSLGDNDIPHIIYGKIAYYLSIIENYVNYNMDTIKRSLIDNLKNEYDKISEYRLFGKIEHEEENNNFKKLKEEMIHSLNFDLNKEILLTDEQIEQAYKIYCEEENVLNKNNKITSNNIINIINLREIEKHIVEMSSKGIYLLKEIMKINYKKQNIYINENEENRLIILLTTLSTIECDKYNFDKIKTKQINDLCETIEKIIQKNPEI